MLYPIIPGTSLKVLEIFKIKEKDININSIRIHDNLKKNDKLDKISMLFKKIEKND